MLHKFPKSLALAAGLLSATGFAPLELWPVTLACLALLTWLVETAPNRRAAFVRGWLFGVGHFGVGLNWIAHAFTFQDAMPHGFGYGAVVLLSLYLAVYPALATLAAWWGAKRLGRGFPLLFAASWIVTEYLRATLFTGFAWNPLGAIAAPLPTALYTRIVGTYGLSGLLVAFAGLFVRLARTLPIPLRDPGRKSFPRYVVQAMGYATTLGLLPVSLFLAVPLWPFANTPQVGAAAPLVRIVQPNIGQDVKYSRESEAANYRKLAILSGKPTREPRLIFWPEAAIPAYLDMEPEWRQRLAGLLGPNDLLMTGGDKVYFKTVNKGFYQDRTLTGANNSLWIIDARAHILGRYSKAHLVPYGEYLPMRQLLTPLGLSRLVPGDADFWPGPGPQSLALPAVPGRPALRMAVQICYEIIFSGQVIDRAHRPDFLFNPSNDAWFGSWGPPQHLAQARLRAIEEGLPIIRSTPTGISAIIDARGIIREKLVHRTPGYIATRLPPPGAPTLFASIGNWAPMSLALLLMATALLTSIATRRARR